MRYRLLGPLEVTREGDRLPLGGPKQRLVLAHLLIRANETVSADLLIDELWGEEPPNAARSSLQAYVSHLRKALGGDRLEGRPPGYVLHVTPDELDLLRFEALIGRARGTAPTDLQAAARLLSEAEGLWRGEPLADLSGEPSLQPEIERLAEIRLGAVEDRVEVELAMGRHHEQIPELERLAIRHPLRERLQGQLMLALYRAGRQAEALEAYRRLRTGLDSELGVEPSPAVERLQHQILTQDEGLELRGEPLRGYRLLARVGVGPHGVVHRAFEAQTERDLAVKVLGARIANQPDFVRTFEAEARRFAQIENPHLLPILDWWREPDAAYLVMRLMPGGNLADRLASDPLGEAEVVRWADQVGSALTAIHRHGRPHGDLHPNNVLLDDGENAYLADAALGHDAARPSQGRAGDRPDYVAPESRDGAGPSIAADVYAFGVMLGELILHSPLGNRGVPAVLARAVSAVPDERPDAVADLVDAVRRLVLVSAAGGSIERAAPRAPRNPYKGLRAFEEADADDFEGRAELVRTLVARIGEPGAARRLLVVVGPSGSGKSSVVNAGLIPALRGGAVPGSDEWFVSAMTPGARPFEQLERALLSVAVGSPPALAELLDSELGWQPAIDRVLPPGAELLLIIDQFEELFTLVPDAGTRQRFMDALARTVEDPASAVRIVIALRADFYDRPLGHERLGRQIASRTQVVPPLATGELERVIGEPARRVGLELEQGLAAHIVTEMSEHPGALPLLQYVLAELWERRDRARVTLAAYQASGGISAAVARRAEELVGQLDAEQQEAARQLFLRLVEPGEGAPDTGRRVRRSELRAVSDDRGSTDEVIDRFARYRLLLLDRDPATREPTVQLAHEALLRAWPRLQHWVDAARDDLRMERRLAGEAEQWLEADRDPSFLLTGSRLEQTLTWAAAERVQLAAREREYLATSQEERDRLSAEDEDRRGRERAAERRAVTRLRALVVTLGISALLAGGLSLFAFSQSQRAARIARDATSRELAGASLANLEVDPERSILLALEAVETTRSVDGTVLREALDALHQAVGTSRVLLTLPRTGGVAFTPDGRRLVTAGREGLTIWDTATGQVSVELGGGPMLNLALSTDGTRIVTTGAEDHAVRLWNAGAGEELASFEVGTPRSAAVTGDGTLLAATDGDGFVWVWDARSPTPVLKAPVDDPSGVAFSPDGRRLAVASQGERAAVIWDLETRTRQRVLSGPGGVVDVAWSPDGTYLATASDDFTAKVWDAETGAELSTLTGHSGFVFGIDISADSALIATGGQDATVRVWDARSGVELMTLPGLSAGNVAFSPDGLRLAGASASETKVWDISSPGRGELFTAVGHAETVFQAVFSPDGTRLATASWDHTARIWEVPSGMPTATFLGHTDKVYRAAFSPDGTRVTTASLDGTARIWDAATGAQMQVLDLQALSFGPSNPPSMASSPDGRLLAMGTDGGDVVVWEVSTGQPAFVVSGHAAQVADIAFGADGTRIATASYDKTVRLWDAASGEAVGSPWVLADAALAVAISPDGRWVAGTGSGGDIVLWDAATGVELRRLTGHSSYVWSLAFSPTGDRLASTGFDRTIRIWDPETGVELVQLTEARAPAGVAFSPDGRYLASAGDDGATRVYVLDPAELVALARERVTRELSVDECRQYLHTESCPAR